MQFHQQPLPLPETRWFNLNVQNPGLITNSVSGWPDKSLEDKGCLQAREMVVSGEFVRGLGEVAVSIKSQVREMTAQGKLSLCGPREFTLLNLLSKFRSPDFDRDIIYTKSGRLTLQGTETVPSPGSLRYLACPRVGKVRSCSLPPL